MVADALIARRGPHASPACVLCTRGVVSRYNLPEAILVLARAILPPVYLAYARGSRCADTMARQASEALEAASMDATLRRAGAGEAANKHARAERAKLEATARAAGLVLDDEGERSGRDVVSRLYKKVCSACHRRCRDKTRAAPAGAGGGGGGKKRRKRGGGGGSDDDDSDYVPLE